MKTAIVLFNLGGPDNPRAVAPFRRNLFRDPAILRVPFFIRPGLARLIAARSRRAARHSYALLGGKSPLLELTQRQAESLQVRLADLGARCFIAMRYWHPFAVETIAQLRRFGPDRILLLPLYPQFSTTTTASALSDWHESAARAGLVCPTTTLCCYFADPGFIDAWAGLIRRAVAQARAQLAPGAALRLLFSAHGLPQRIVARGDPYQMQIIATVTAVMQRLDDLRLDHRVCYQSRATPQRWLTPATPDAIAAAGAEGAAVLLVPIAFVSDHVETLVELDVEAAAQAKGLGIGYFRAPVPNADPGFIEALAGLARRALAQGPGLCSFGGGRACELGWSQCPWPRTANAA